jgi:hypothetical protein
LSGSGRWYQYDPDKLHDINIKRSGDYSDVGASVGNFFGRENEVDQ